MAHKFLVVIMFFCSIIANDKVIGILELPLIYGEYLENGPPEITPPHQINSIPIFSEPHDNSLLIMKIKDSKSFESEEYSYEAYGATVYDTIDKWMQIRITDSSINEEKGWISPVYHGKFYSREELLKNACHLTEYWDGIIYTDSTLKTTHDKADNKENYPINTLKLIKVNGLLIAEIEIISEHPCRGDNNSVKVHGWIPVHNHNGEFNLWFYPRGC